MWDVLTGVRVLEVAQWWLVPAAGAVLTDWGARVFKVEHPLRGDPQRALFGAPGAGRESIDFLIQQSNRGKRSVGLDIATEAGRRILLRMVETSDVFLTSFLPDARRKLRIDVEDVRAINPRIIYVRGSGQGPAGPDAGKGGYDATSFWARGGVASTLTRPDMEVPVMHRAALGDSMGALTLAGGIAAALFRRERSGIASVLDVSLLNTAMWVLAQDVIASGLPERAGAPLTRPRHSTPNPIANYYRSADGRWLMLVMLESDRYWDDFCRHIERPDLALDERFRDAEKRFENREACIAALDAEFARRTLREWTERLATLAGAWAPIQSVSELHRDAQVIANGYLPEVEVAGRRLRLVASPAQFDEQPLGPLSAAPELGQHTEEVLLELGYSWEEIARYKLAGAIG